jgi:hypothetical protein
MVVRGGPFFLAVDERQETMSNHVTLTLPPGPLGVILQQQRRLDVDEAGQRHLVAPTIGARSNDSGLNEAEGAGFFCLVKSTTLPNSLLETNDVILSLNGITLSTVTGGLKAWVTLFGAFTERKVVVLRRPMTTNTTHVAHHPPHVAQQQQQLLHHVTAMAEIATKSPLESLPLSIGNAPKQASATVAAAVAAAVGKASAAAMRSGGTGTVATKTKKQQAKEAGKRKPPPPSLKQGHKKSKGASAVFSTGATKRHDDFEHDDNYMKLLTDGYPDAGRVSSCLTYYVASNNETLPKIAEKLGLSSWKILNDIEFNKRFYGKITGNMTFKRDTVIKIPTSQCSKWKLSKLVDNQIEEIKSMATCSKCLIKEKPDDTDEMLMCDGCDLAIHVSCAGLFIVPDGDWLCKACLDILDARKKSLLISGDGDRRSLKAKMPPLKKLDNESAHMVTTAKIRYREEMMARKMAALRQLEENQSVMAVASKARVNEMENVIRDSTALVAEAEKIHNSARSAKFQKHGK